MYDDSNEPYPGLDSDPNIWALLVLEKDANDCEFCPYLFQKAQRHPEFSEALEAKEKRKKGKIRLRSPLVEYVVPGEFSDSSTL